MGSLSSEVARPSRHQAQRRFRAHSLAPPGERHSRGRSSGVKGLRVVAPRATLTDGELVAGLLRGVLQEHDREAMAALTAFADANGWQLAA